MSTDLVKRDLFLVILGYLVAKKIDPKNGQAILDEAPGIWAALCESGKMPKYITYENLVDSIIDCGFNGNLKVTAYVD